VPGFSQRNNAWALRTTHDQGMAGDPLLENREQN